MSATLGFGERLAAILDRIEGVASDEQYDACLEEMYEISQQQKQAIADEKAQRDRKDRCA
jgi:hypothetical protein